MKYNTPMSEWMGRGGVSLTLMLAYVETFVNLSLDLSVVILNSRAFASDEDTESVHFSTVFTRSGLTLFLKSKENFKGKGWAAVIVLTVDCPLYWWKIIHWYVWSTAVKEMCHNNKISLCYCRFKMGWCYRTFLAKLFSLIRNSANWPPNIWVTHNQNRCTPAPNAKQYIWVITLNLVHIVNFEPK